MSLESYKRIGVDLQELLKLENPPVSIAFTDEPPKGLANSTETVASGCVFWIRGFAGSFYTDAKDHANCNIGSYTHGFLDLPEVKPDSCADIGLMLKSDYLTPEMLNSVPRMDRRYNYVAYGPLGEAGFEPGVVLMVCNPHQAMLVAEAAIAYRLMGKPTCSAISMSFNDGEICISLGCITNRIRTGIKLSELVVTIPRAVLSEFILELRRVVDANNKVASAVSAMLAR